MTRVRKAERLAQYEAASYRAVLRALSSNLRRLREERAWTQERAAEQCALPLVQYARLETEATNFIAVTLSRLCDGFALPAAALLAQPYAAAVAPPRVARPARVAVAALVPRVAEAPSVPPKRAARAPRPR